MEHVLSGEQLAAVKDAAARIWAELHGTGPREVKSYLNDDILFIVMRGATTREQRTLAERGRGDVAREARRVVENAIRDDQGRAVKEREIVCKRPQTSPRSSGEPVMQERASRPIGSS